LQQRALPFAKVQPRAPKQAVVSNRVQSKGFIDGFDLTGLRCGHTVAEIAVMSVLHAAQPLKPSASV